MAERKDNATKLPRRARAGTALSQERWEKILEVATRLFRQRGFAGASMQDVSDEVGLLKGSLYYYVKSKEELLFEVLRDLHQGGGDIVESVQYESDDPLGQLKEYLRRLTIYAGEQRARLAIFFRDFGCLPIENQKQIIAERDMYVVCAVRLIEEAKAKKQIDSSINSTVAALSVLGATSVTHEWYRPDGPLSLETIGEQVAAIIIDGLGGASVTRPSRRARDTSQRSRAKTRSTTRKS
ncbi:MAG: TetR/AcrR family transcriptional regulator [Hyphomonadaceae bacterium]|nr:TetR/AcrR family transcriptional regulator [Hyphomonadaceae bacterium]GIK48312.1 MAG: TetR family transcriptional regulator [Alphaproteobacteria bacterium]